ncbi:MULTISPECIES: right-handed parallel beta-helix repeat-containing protein [unclassified Methanoculleus]|uniref:right-handed parallel beta-helix repeat-containing protein n=1 Tax=unclassified Methanoculleus TaxID=2619537 RepID=UPI0025F656FA|nr:right-handed parallel beta-helix repeat-containing protein [Methanoculleus sp. UBA377]
MIDRKNILRLTALLLACFLVPALAPVSAAESASPATLTVAASDSTELSKNQADYVCDGVNDQAEIQAALAALPEGGTVALSEGTFNCAGVIAPPAGTTLSGQGPDATNLVFTNDGRIDVDREHVTLDGFHVEGSGYSSGVKWLGVITVRASHAAVHNLTGTADASIQAVFLLIHDPTVYAPTLEDVEFVNCKAVDTGTYGFLHNAWGSSNKVIKDVRYENCAAINCGSKGAFNPWITGFDFAELNDIEGLRVTNCLAEGNLESGFHFEFDPKVTDAVLENCVSRNNGQKPYPDRPYQQSDMSTHYFGAGYYAPNADVTFKNCTAESNSLYGFYTTNGGKLYDCVEKDTGAGKTDYTQRQPAGYYSAPCRSANPSLVMENCTSIDSHGYGIQIDRASNVQIENFQMVNPAGIDGKGSSLGGQFSDASVDIIASGDQVETLVWAKDNQNAQYTGEITSDSPKAFLVEGGQNVRTEGMTVAPASA